MARREGPVYSPGELSRVRDKLGIVDAEEAKRIAQKLGGQVGYERTEEEEKSRQPAHRTRHERVEVKIGAQGGKPGRRVDLAPDADSESPLPAKKKHGKQPVIDPEDDPSVPLRAGYWDRVRMDRLAGQPEFEIKSSAQVLYSMISLFSNTTDNVNPTFVTRRMTEYYKKIEYLVISTRNLLPRNNIIRNERMKKTAPLAYSILDAIRYWDIERISTDLARIQSRPRNARVGDFADIIRAVYRPLFILDKMDLDAHIRGAYRILYKLLYIESPIDAQNKYQELVRTALIAFAGVQKDIRYLLHPILLKLISSTFLPYNILFVKRKHRLMAFLNATEGDQISPGAMPIPGDAKDSDVETLDGDGSADADQKPADVPGQASGGASGQTPDGEKGKEGPEEEKENVSPEAAEKKAVERGLQIMDTLFPQAGWDRASTYPDFYPYFVGIFDLKRGIVNIAPTDPMLQIFILMRSLEELFFGLRYVNFTSVPGYSGNMERVDTILGELINNWHYYITLSFEKEYLTRMAEYVRILEGSIEERNSPYTRKLITEMHWIKRFYLLPYYKFESLTPPSVQKKDTVPVYSKIKSLRKYLTAIATGIEHGNRAGGAEAHAPCDGIDNPWDPYVFQVPNPLSIRLDAILGAKGRNNASLLYFCLAIATVLDHIVNNADSWAYTSRQGALFRSVNGEGILPLTGVDEHIDADGIFKQMQKQRQKGKV